MKEIYLAGGCFWGVQHYLGFVHGVVATEVGYANGPDPRTQPDGSAPGDKSVTYAQVCASSGHAETVHVTYDPDIITLPQLLDRFFETIDPTSVNRQGHDSGVQYRTGVWWTDSADEPSVRAALHDLQARTPAPLAIESGPLRNFTLAEDNHQDYLDKKKQYHMPHFKKNLMK